MRVLGVLAAWGVLAVLATLCFAVGGSIGYRRGVQDAVRQLRERRSGSTGCRPLPLPHHRRRPITRMHASPRRSAQAKAAASPTVHRLRAHLTRAKMSPALAGVTAMVFLLFVPGVALGSTSAQPGEALWPVKRGVERARLAIAMGPSSDMQIHVELASRRLDELDNLLADDDAEPQVVEDVIADLRGHTEAAADQLEQVEADARPEVAERVEQVVRRQVVAIDVMLDLDCGIQARDDKCVALDDTRDVSEQLHQTMVMVAMGDGDSPAAVRPAAVMPSVAPEQSSESGAAAASEGASAAAAAAAVVERPNEPSSERAVAAEGGSESPSERPSESKSAAPAAASGSSPASSTAPAAGSGEAPAAGTGNDPAKDPETADTAADAADEAPTAEVVP